jgi:rhodanese-related sulfurtransferase
MFNVVRTLTTNQRLAVLAIVLGAVATAATPTRGSRLRVDSREMADLMARGLDRVEPRTLADWIIQGRTDYRLVDLREPAAFASGLRIPTAENIPVTALLAADLPWDGKIVLVGEDEARAAQAWFLLTAQGRRGAAILRGGLRGWREDVLHPNLDLAPAADRAKLEAVCRYFGGAPRTGAASGSLPAPALAQADSVPPPPPASGPKKAAPPRKREGC